MEYELSVNNLCNNNCTICKMIGHKLLYEKSFDDIINEVDAAHKNGVDAILVTGGEPTIRIDILRILDYIKSKGMKISLRTNGRMFHYKSFAKEVEKRDVKRYIITIFGHNEKIHNSITNDEQSFTQTISGVKNIPVDRIHVHVYVTKQNYRCLPLIVRFSSRLGIRSIGFSLPFEVETVEEPTFPRMEDVIIQLAESYKLAKDLGMNIEINNQSKYLEYVLNYYHIRKGDRPCFFRVDIHIIKGCNSNCIMCDNWKSDIKTIYSRKNISDLLKELKDFGVTEIRFHGQEPTLRKDLISIISEAKNMGFNVGIKTNCNLLDENYVKRLCETKIDSVYVSIDSPKESLHNKIRGNNDSFRNNIDAIGYMRKYQKVPLKVYSNSVVTGINYRELDGMMDLAHKMGIDKVSFTLLNDKNKKNVSGLLPTKLQLEEFFLKIVPKIFEKCEKYNIPVSFSPFFFNLVDASPIKVINELLNNPKKYEHEIDNFHRMNYGGAFFEKYGCCGPLDHLTIDAEGNVYSCCVVPRTSKTARSNIQRFSFKKMWGMPSYKRLRERAGHSCNYYKSCGSNFGSRKVLFMFINNRQIVANINGPEDYSKFLRNFYSLPRAWIEKYQFDKLRQLLFFAYFNIPFYRERFEKCGISPFDIKTKEDLLRIPVTTKNDLRNNFPHKMLSDKMGDDVIVEHTSGTFDEIVNFAREAGFKRFTKKLFTFQNISDWNWMEPYVVFTTPHCMNSACTEYTEHNDSNKNNSNEIKLPTKNNIMTSNFSEMWERYNILYGKRPKILHVNPSYLKHLAIFIQKNDLNIPVVGAISSTYEILTPSTKKYLESFFNCSVFDQYGCSEIGPIANSCNGGKRHIFMESVFVEILKNKKSYKKKNIGKIVVTDLDNYAMPLIRYDTGDLGSKSNDFCPCGKNTEILNNIYGRESDIIEINKKVITPLDIDTIFGKMSGIDFYQIIYKNEKCIVVNIVKNEIWTDKSKSIFYEYFKKNLGKTIKIEFHFVNEIKTEASGKFRIVKNCVGSYE